MKVFIVLYENRTIDGLECEIVSIHKKRKGAIKAVAKKKAEILENWGVTDINHMKEGYEIGENHDGYFMIFDNYDIDRTEVSIEEQELLED